MNFQTDHFILLYLMLGQRGPEFMFIHLQRYEKKFLKIFSELGFSNACRFCPSHFLKVWLVKKDSKFSIFSNDNSFQVDTSCYRVEIITFLHRNQFSRKFMVFSKNFFFKTNVFLNSKC